MQTIKTLFTSTAILLLSACVSVAPDFQPDPEVITHFRLGGFHPLKTGKISGDKRKIDKITIRGGKMKSPYDNSYVAYLKAALEMQLKYSYIWDENSPLKIDAIFQKNDLDASGTNIGVIELTVQFIIYESDKVLYENTHAISHEWNSSFVGAVAIPAAQQNYQVAIRKLLKDFLLSEDVIKILSISGKN